MDDHAQMVGATWLAIGLVTVLIQRRRQDHPHPSEPGEDDVLTPS